MSSYPGVPSLRLQSAALEITVLPGIGAKIFDLTYRPTGQSLLWHNPRIAPQSYPVDANFDNYWCGGWDDAFPTCEACTHQGEQYPNLGELRSVPWDVVTQGASEVELSAGGPISPVKARKQIRLTGDSLEMTFSVKHVGHSAMDFIWGTHPAWAVTPDCILRIPARRGIVGYATRPMLGEPGQQYDWPVLHSSDAGVDMSRLLPPGPYAAGHYATDLSAGWYAIEYPKENSGVLFEFPLETCPYLWMWLSYGGWRGYYVAVVEPWTSCPVTLSDAVSARTHRVLKPGETFSCKVRATPWQGLGGLPNLLAQRGLQYEKGEIR